MILALSYIPCFSRVSYIKPLIFCFTFFFHLLLQSVAKERQEFLNLVNKEIELYNTMLEKEGTKGEEEARRAYKAAREESDHAAEIAAGEKVSSALIERVDAMLQKLEKEIDDVDARIGNRWQLLDR
jgi:LETM1 and EF-hand domain-containing protein 1